MLKTVGKDKEFKQAIKMLKTVGKDKMRKLGVLYYPQESQVLAHFINHAISNKLPANLFRHPGNLPFIQRRAIICKSVGSQTSNSKKESFVFSDLPDSPVDLVINCLDCHENVFLHDQPWYKAAVEWASRNRAPVLNIDPPVNELEQGIDAKWSLALGLPLPLGERAGRIYLCDIGIPQKVFEEVGINYHSPFGCKFVIPLHST